VSAFTFVAPLFLLALFVLPVLWLLLRLTPPRPREEIFPPFFLLKRLVPQEHMAAKSPWWLLLLRLSLTACIIIALARPIFRPTDQLPAEQSGLVLLVDNSFAAAPMWHERVEVARQLIAGLADGGRIYLIPTLMPENAAIGPYGAQEALQSLEQIQPYPLEADRLTAVKRLEQIVAQEGSLQLAYLSDGLQTPKDEMVFSRLAAMNFAQILWYQGEVDSLMGIIALENAAQMLEVKAVRARGDGGIQKQVIAYDGQSRPLGKAALTFVAGSMVAKAGFLLPFEMRNDVAFVQIEGERQAAATFVNDSAQRRRRIALLVPDGGEMVQPLLSPLYYPTQALRPFGDIITMSGATSTTSLADGVEGLLAANPALLVMGDEAGIADAVVTKLVTWVEEGGTLLRFAGSHLANAPRGTASDRLLPVTLRRGERNLGGVMIWQNPQKIAPFPPASPFLGLEIPPDVTISRQILPEPEAELYDKSWIVLEDGTPLVTAKRHGLGWMIFVHTAAVPDWSNLPLSGFFVDMLRRIVDISNQPRVAQSFHSSPQKGAGSPDLPPLTLAPWRMISPDGRMEAPQSFHRPVVLAQRGAMLPTFHNPPGLYGGEDFFVGVNVLTQQHELVPLRPPPDMPFHIYSYEVGNNVGLHGIFWGVALALFALDSLIMLLKASTGFVWPWWHHRRRYHRRARQGLLGLVVMTTVLWFSPLDPAQARDAHFSGKTHLAYVKTGNEALDDLTQAGLDSLSRFIEARTNIELGDAVGVTLESDELAFYPLLYWPLDEAQNLPAATAISRLDFYMRQGGTVLFDTRDHLLSDMMLDQAPTPATRLLRHILAEINVPPLEPAPPDHVIARSFYIMPDFPGRYRGASLWLEASLQGSQVRAVQAGDGVSPILITANDFIGAWASDDNGQWLYSTIPDESAQRLWAFRGGLNIVLYVLTGNYKADQIHAPEILKRLGQK